MALVDFDVLEHRLDTVCVQVVGGCCVNKTEELRRKICMGALGTRLLPSLIKVQFIGSHHRAVRRCDGCARFAVFG